MTEEEKKEIKLDDETKKELDEFADEFAYFVDSLKEREIVTDVCITEQDRQAMSIIPIDQYFPKRSYGIVTRKGKFLSAPAKRFIEFMNESYGKTENTQ